MTDDRQTVLNLHHNNDIYSIDWVHVARRTQDWYTKEYNPLPDPGYIKKMITYFTDSGRAFWNEKEYGEYYANQWNVNRAGKELASHPTKTRQTVTFSSKISAGLLKGKKVLYSRVVWCWCHGEWPDQDLVVDHIDGDPRNNRIDNLRLITKRENSLNRKIHLSNSSGYVGVSRLPEGQQGKENKWSARISHEGKQKYLGSFRTKEEAIDARKAAEIKYGYHENHGRDHIVEED